MTVYIFFLETAELQTLAEMHNCLLIFSTGGFLIPSLWSSAILSNSIRVRRYTIRRACLARNPKETAVFNSWLSICFIVFCCSVVLLTGPVIDPGKTARFFCPFKDDASFHWNTFIKSSFLFATEAKAPWMLCFVTVYCVQFALRNSTVS